MSATMAAVLFAMALLLNVLGIGLGTLDSGNLVTAGLLFLALHLGGGVNASVERVRNWFH